MPTKISDSNKKSKLSFIDSFIKQNKHTFVKYKEYIKDNDWVTVSDMKNRRGLYELELALISSIFDRLHYFVKQAPADVSNKKVDKFLETMINTIREHNIRVEDYFISKDWTIIENLNIRKEELAFQDFIFGKSGKIIDKLDALNIDSESKDNSTLKFFEGKLASVAMYDIISELYTDINKNLKKLNINWKKKPSQDMFIYKRKIPEYNENKHFFEQDPVTLQFYVDELKKIREGIIIDGVFIHPWLYWHLNFFKTAIPQKDGSEKVMNPPFRDNEWYIINNYQEAKESKKILMIAASRRLAKTTFIASISHWGAVVKKSAEIVVGGGNTKDLGQIAKNLKISIQNIHPAFRLYNNTNDWNKKVSIGLKKTTNQPIEQAIIHIINLIAGGKLNSELLAGYSPDIFVIDEVLKFPFIDALEAAKPSFETPFGWRTTPILSGTGGNEDLSKDGLRALKNPKAFDILEMNWDLLEKHVPKEEITWTRKKFGTFAPAQMSYKDGLVKLESSLGEYLGRPESKELCKIKMLTTNWHEANKIIKQDRKDKEKDLKALTKEKVYYPIDTDEIFLSGKTNPFPAMAAKKHKDYLVETGLIGKKVELYKDASGNIKSEFSDKVLPDFPFEGGYINSPVVLHEEIPDKKPPRGLYIAGLDDYKQEQADTDSVGSFYIYKRSSLTDEWGDRPVASYCSRPDPHSEFHRNGLMLLEAFNAECFMENEDMSFKDYLDRIHKADTWLLSGVDFATEYKLNNTEKRTYGWTPTARNKSFLISVVIKYTKELIDTYDKEGNEITMLGVQRINDISLLEEIINYKEGANHDRITAFGSALIYANYLDATYQVPEFKKERTERRLPTKSGNYSNRRFNPF